MQGKIAPGTLACFLTQETGHDVLGDVERRDGGAGACPLWAELPGIAVQDAPVSKVTSPAASGDRIPVSASQASGLSPQHLQEEGAPPGVLISPKGSHPLT